MQTMEGIVFDLVFSSIICIPISKTLILLVSIDAQCLNPEESVSVIYIQKYHCFCSDQINAIID